MVSARTFHRKLMIVVVLGASLHVAAAQNVSETEPPANPSNSTTSTGASRHLQALQEIATANGGNRAAGTPGYDRSAEYVADRLKEAGYTVRFEEFEFPFFEERTPPVLVMNRPDSSPDPAAAGSLRTLV